jgi:hypothetical protein
MATQHWQPSNFLANNADIRPALTNQVHVQGQPKKSPELQNHVVEPM